jgi:purine-nucleoside phosphorylase
MYEQIEVARAYVASRSQQRPSVALILGSGLGGLADELRGADTIDYADIPHFPRSTVEGHEGELALGSLSGRTVAVMRGRFHFYEGYDLAQTTVPVRVLQAIGARTLIVTNAAGGLRADWHVGDLMRISDHINFPGMAGQHPLRGPNDPRLGVRFPAMMNVYDPELGALAQHVATDMGVTLCQGVYAMLAGPSFETPAELRMLQSWGVDAVGMSTVPEVIAARHGGMRVLGISMISNIATPDAPPANHEEVLSAGAAVTDTFTSLIREILARMPD